MATGWGDGWPGVWFTNLTYPSKTEIEGKKAIRAYQRRLEVRNSARRKTF